MWFWITARVSRFLFQLKYWRKEGVWYDEDKWFKAAQDEEARDITSTWL